MAINPLELPRWQPAPQIDWTPLSRIGEAIGQYRQQQLENAAFRSYVQDLERQQAAQTAQPQPSVVFPSSPASQPVPSNRAPAGLNRVPVASSPTTWGDAEAVAAGLYEAPKVPGTVPPVQPEARNVASAPVPSPVPARPTAPVSGISPQLANMLEAGGDARKFALAVINRYLPPDVMGQAQIKNMEEQRRLQEMGLGQTGTMNAAQIANMEAQRRLQEQGLGQTSTFQTAQIANMEAQRRLQEEQLNKPTAVQPGSVLVSPRTGEKIYGNDQSMLPPETIDQMARQALAGDTSVFMNLGRGAQAGENIVAVRKRMAEINSQAGETGTEQAARNAEFFGQKSGQRVLGTRQANMEMAVSEAQKVAPLALEASAAVNRTQYPTLNSVLMAYEKGTGDENVVRLAVATNSLINVYSRAIAPTGVATVSDKEHAREILSSAWSKGQYASAVDQMMKEMAAARQAPGEVRQNMREAVTGKKTESAPSAPQFGSVKIPIAAKDRLLADKDPNARQNFDAIFGEGAAARILGPVK